jgi:hypothetical protein
LGYDTSDAHTLLHVHMLMMRSCLVIDEGEASAMVAQRLAVEDLARSFTPAVLEVDETARVFDFHDQRAMAMDQEDATKQEPKHEVFAKAFQGLRASRGGALGNGGKDKAGGRSKAGGRGGKGGRPRHVPARIAFDDL